MLTARYLPTIGLRDTCYEGFVHIWSRAYVSEK